MKKIILICILFTLTFSFTACQKNDSKPSQTETEIVAGDTTGSKYLAAFANSETDDPGKMVKELLALGVVETELVETEVSEGYLDGFTEDITGFRTGFKFSPMIGAIPFVGYVFETEKPDELLAKLKETADPAWNICTEADETVSYARGNLVFFMMCSNEDQ